MVWNHENQVAATRGGQCSVDAWEHAKPKRKWKEVSAENEALNALMKAKKITWNKSGKESARKKADLYTVLESAATDEKKEEKGKEMSSVTSSKLFFRGKKRTMKQRVSWKRCGKTWRLLNTKALRRSKVCAVLFGSTLIRSTEIGVARRQS